ncbi:MAG TPA: tetratricopeptide repeat protein [Planctomycetota bacterium]|nr:tetratricopeptide repeat protein [Planctomycetota bacterium]
MLRELWRRHIHFSIPVVLFALIVVALTLADVTEQLVVVGTLSGMILAWLLVPFALHLYRGYHQRRILRQRLPDLPPATRHTLIHVLELVRTGNPRELDRAATLLNAVQSDLAAAAAAVAPPPAPALNPDAPTPSAPAAPAGPTLVTPATPASLAQVPELPALLEGLRGLVTVRSISLRRELPGLLHGAFPEVERQMFCRGAQMVSKPNLVEEVKNAPLVELERILRRVVATVDLLVECSVGSHLLTPSEADQYLAAMVGRSPARAFDENWRLWWQSARPRLLKAGGAALLAMRLLRDRRYNQVYQLGQRLWVEGVPTRDFTMLLDLAAFYRFWMRRRSPIDDPAGRGRRSCPYFTDGRYLNVTDFLKYPLADTSRVSEFCKNYPDYKKQKVDCIENMIELLGAYPGEMDQILAETLIRLVGDVPRQALGRGGWRPAVWREFWTKLIEQDGFEPGLSALVAGVRSIEAGQLAEARGSLEAAARRMPDATAPVINLVYLECQAGRPDLARRAIEAVLDARPNQGTLALGLGSLALYNLHDLALAEKLFTRAQKLMFEPVEAHISLGQICLMTNRAKLAQDHFRRAYELDPSCPQALLGLARTMIEMKMYWRAIGYLKTVTLQHPGATADWANFFLFQTYREMGQNRDAIERLKSVPDLLIDDPDMLEEISYYLESQQEYPWALELQKRAMLYRSKQPPKQSSRASGANPWDETSEGDEGGGLKEGPTL